jgi:hypothetical protein
LPLVGHFIYLFIYTVGSFATEMIQQKQQNEEYFDFNDGLVAGKKVG